MADLVIKDRIIGKGRPLVCVSVMGADKTSVIEDTKKLLAAGVEMLEWRVDAFNEQTNTEAVLEVFEELRDLVKDTILVFTYRSKGQGGLGEASIDDIHKIQELAAECGVADFIDVEFFAEKKPGKTISKLQNMGAHIISSHHDFNETPDSSVVRMLLETMKESGTDIVKIALMPQEIEDVLRVLSETVHFHKKYPDTPLITMSMGATGSVSRVAGEYFGSCVTFGAGDEASAPGQLPQSKLACILDILHESIEG